MNTLNVVNKPQKGKLAKGITQANVDLIVYTVPEKISNVAIDISLLNINSVDAIVKIAVSLNYTAVLEDYIEYDFILPANSVLERTVKCSSGERIIVQTNESNVVVRISGYEGL